MDQRPTLIEMYHKLSHNISKNISGERRGTKREGGGRKEGAKAGGGKGRRGEGGWEFSSKESNKKRMKLNSKITLSLLYYLL